MTIESEIAGEEGPSLKARATAGALWILLEMIGVQGTSFAVFATIAHFVSPSDVGLISVCFLVTQSIKMLAIDPTVTAITRRQQATDADYTTAFWITIAISVAAAALVAGIAPFCERLFNSPGLTRVLVAMSTTLVVIGIARTHEGWMTRNFRFRPMAIRALVGAVIGGVTGVVLAIHGWGVWALVTQQLVTTSVAMILIWITCPWRPGFDFSVTTAREIFLFLRSIWANALVGITSSNCDTFLVAYSFGPAAVGVYNVAKRVRLAIQLVASNPINGVLTPALAEIQGDPVRLKRGMLSALALICAACGPVFVGASAVSNEAIQVVFGARWADAGPVLELLSFGGLAIVLLLYCENVFVTLKRPSWNLAVTVAYAVIALAGFLLLRGDPRVSVAVPFVLPYVVTLPMALVMVSRLTGISLGDQIGAMAPGLVSCGLMFVVVRVADHLLGNYSLTLRLALLCPLGAVVYTGAIWVFGRQTAMLVVDLGRRAFKRFG